MIQRIDANKILKANPWKNLSTKAHKYDRGHVMIIGGSEGKMGAPCLAGLAALRSGAGWVTVVPCMDRPERDIPLELTVEKFWQKRKLDVKKISAFVKTRNVKAIVIGPGCMSSPLNSGMVKFLKTYTEQGGFVVLDAGALHGFFDSTAKVKFASGKMALTPHPGEWKKLSKRPLADPVKESAKIQKRNVSVLFKNSEPLLFVGDKIFMCAEGNNSLSRAGSGDVLAGCVAAHGAMGCEAGFSLARAQTMVGRMAKQAAKIHGQHGVLATDIISQLGRWND